MLQFKHIASLLILTGAIKTWQSGENINVADLNSNFQHIHSLMVGGHGGRLVDADVNSSANISSSKLAAYRQIPVAWGFVTCVIGNVCTLGDSVNIASLSSITTGQYRITLNYTATDIKYAVTMGTDDDNVDGGAPNVAGCYASAFPGVSRTVTTFDVFCSSVTSFNPVVPYSFSFAVFDGN